LWYFENNELKEMKADKQPIGKYEHAYPFTTHQLKLQQNSSLYMFTDGYADQFGVNNKKMTKKRFRSFIESIQDLNMNDQKGAVEDYFNNWMFGVDQVDDVCVIGIKL
jgi:serine phosphatase RsbU (regulator of sigma subunit)